MSETALTDQAGIERTETGEIKDQASPLTSQTETKTEPETKPETKSEDKPAKEGDTLLSEKKPETKAEGPPEKYEDFKVPEGHELDKAVATEAGTLFKELGLSQEAGQKLVDFYVKQTLEAQEAPFKAYQEMRNAWRDEANNHPQLRGRLGETGEVRVGFGRLLDSLGDPNLAKTFKEAMDLTGAGDHPAFIRVVDILAQRLTEGRHVSGTGPTTVKKPGEGAPSAAKALYPNLA